MKEQKSKLDRPRNKMRTLERIINIRKRAHFRNKAQIRKNTRGNKQGQINSTFPLSAEVLNLTKSQ